MDRAELAARLTAAAKREGTETSDFDLNPAVDLPAGRKLRPAGVLIAVEPGDGSGAWGGARVILTKRSPRLKHHPGQVAFPGGKVDPGDDGPVGAALREAEEEVRLPRSCVDVLGTLPPHETVTGFTVTPVLGLVASPFVERAEAGEVAEIFRVPLVFLADPANYRVEGRRWQGRRRLYYCAPWGPYYVWGATARMLRGLAARLAS